MSRTFAEIGARRGRPKPTVACPWSKAAKTRRLRQIEALLANLRAMDGCRHTPLIRDNANSRDDSTFKRFEVNAHGRYNNRHNLARVATSHKSRQLTKVVAPAFAAGRHVPSK